MKSFTENEDEIVIRYVPVKEWILGALLSFLLLALAFIFLYFYFKANYIQSLFDILPVVLIAATAVILIFDFKFILTPLSTVTVSRKTKSADIFRQLIYGSRMQRYYFTQIVKFKSYKTNILFVPQYCLALTLENRKTVKLKIPIGSEKIEITRLIKKLNKLVKSSQ